MGKKEWSVYILRCSDNTLYTGITNDPSRRIDEHNSSEKGAKYTRSRRPVKLVYIKNANEKSAAAREECRIKKLSRVQKLALIDNFTHGQLKP